jgi:oligosaccharyltransferase complex subunit epsilon
MPRAASDAKLLIQSLNKAYAATPTNLKIIDLYVICAVATAVIQVAYMGLVGSFPFNSFLSGVLSCIGTAVLAVCLRIQVNKDNKEFKVTLVSFPFARIILLRKIWHNSVCQKISCRIFPQKGPLLTLFCATWCSTW